MDVSIAGISPAEDDGLEIQRFALRVGDSHVNNPLYLVPLLLLGVGPEHLHDDVQRPGPRQGHVLQERQVFLLSKLVADGFTFSGKTKLTLEIYIVLTNLRKPPSGKRTKYRLCFLRNTSVR